MYNYYKGNSGLSRKIEENPEYSRPSGEKPRENTARQSGGSGPAMPRKKSEKSGVQGILEQLGTLVPGKLSKLESEDYILLLILYLMYRDSGDTELLIIMGALLFM